MAADCNPAALFFALIQQRDEADRLASRILAGGQSVFGNVSHPVPTLQPAELGFLRSITYLFASYFETGRVSVRYLATLFIAYRLDGDRRALDHLQLVDFLRTYLQHNLDVTKHSDRETVQACEDWLEQHCGSRVPGTEQQWKACLCALLEDACHALTALNLVIRGIEGDESRETVVSQWKFELDRYHPPEAFDRVIAQAAGDMGYPYLDVVKLRKRFYDRWLERLRSLTTGYDFEHEARRLVEQALLADASLGMPLTGADVLASFQIEPGPKVRRALELASRRYLEVPDSSKERLIEFLRDGGFPELL